jgi:C-terminal processing protease CtpA/Prc
VIQDHREGHGGTVATTDILVRFSRQTFMPMVSVMRMHAADQGPADEAEGIKLFNKLKSSMWAVVAGSEYPKTHIPVAMLLSWDVSASDFLPYIMKGGPKVRLFGPGPTMGAFGTFYQYSYWGGMLWSIGVEDSLSPEGVTLSGHGVMPDVLVQPTQSDLLAGKDTVHEAALAWVREELAP